MDYNVLLNALIFLIQLILVGIILYYQRMIKNWADTNAARDLSFESEKGKNLATKDDIADITRQIELVKSEISFESQRKKEFIDERKRHLINIIYYAEKIQNSQNRLALYARNSDMQTSIYKLIDDVNADLLEMVHESNIILIQYFHLEGIKALSTLVDDAALFVAEIVTVAHNVSLEQANYKLAKENADKFPHHASQYLEKAIEATDKAVALVDAPRMYKDTMKKDIQQYILWLHTLVGKGLNLKYKLDEQFQPEMFN